VDSRFNIGDIVKIAKNSDFFGTDDSNPGNVEGIVDRTDLESANGYYVQVEWPNDCSNAYRDTDLRLVRRDNGE